MYYTVFSSAFRSRSSSCCCSCGCSSSSASIAGTSFPSSPSSGQSFYRTDLLELFFYNELLGRWLGELDQEGFGDSNTASNNQFLRRFNGMLTAADSGVHFPYDILITDISYNWNTPNNSTGNLQILSNGSVVHTVSWSSADMVSETGLSVVVPSGSVLAYRLNGISANISNSQGRFRFRRII